MAQKVIVTEEEARAIRSLQRLARRWPEGLSLFALSGTIVVTKPGDHGVPCLVERIDIPADGGCPTPDELDQFPDIHLEGTARL